MNLLPNKEKELLKKGLKLRLVVVALFLSAISFLVGFVMLWPSYFLTVENISLSKEENYTLETTKEDVTDEILNLPVEVNSKLAFFQSHVSNISAVEYLSIILNEIGSGITLDSISLLKNQKYKEKQGILILISGVALDRNSLVLFSNSLRQLKSISSVEVPVSNLTKEKNLPFTMNIFIEN